METSKQDKESSVQRFKITTVLIFLFNINICVQHLILNKTLMYFWSAELNWDSWQSPSMELR